MEIVAHILWAATAIAAKRSTRARVNVGWTVWWAAFPERWFGPMIAAGLWLRVVGGTGSVDGHALPHVGVGLSMVCEKSLA